LSPNVKYEELFRKLENEAREAGEEYYIASQRSQVFHRPECPNAKDIASYNTVIKNFRQKE
jgi:hypothetical protein